ncbi:hypothetical protein HMPREF9087_1045 [Enterococcus casseliflavus ATCC 12755]|uniref:Uncharacterized protein n=1 Tax=Enterococcus casseliflavus ATCC 12755 TaxID=888066 RepID=F0EI03_ENTCA|nr:hypothetical protein HMPREF9087_1045 [Enterococcus casseliflavus ATCC 12755]
MLDLLDSSHEDYFTIKLVGILLFFFIKSKIADTHFSRKSAYQQFYMNQLFLFKRNVQIDGFKKPLG